MKQVLQHRIDATFAHYDVNRNGVIELADVYALANRLLLAFGEPASSERGRELVEAYDRFWEAIVGHCGAGRDGRIGPRAYRDAMIEAFVEGGPINVDFLEVVRALLDIADTNGDGRVDAAEFRVLLKARGLSEAECGLAFSHLDLDGDGAISVDEYVAAVRDYYTNPAEDTPGSWLYPEALQRT
ncbi:Ca2+-binding protein, EF-hand superfamily [Lentzea xinjiangensis]|uniref:Ca2+-binding protein, EF-hand superfamily n=1 Tax=Lentzea xinjiangensis TaxID=402600 RepID=A0A1H9IYJ9_9PSEU|nr:EF-hand domain-containing protein [Lentzea xinjiangensis]SEQ79578.1 Ca2+-binding protein, EF-hand superfamily [Lentzea xinjiangensis]